MLSIIRGPLWSGKAPLTQKFIDEHKRVLVFRPPVSNRYWRFDIDSDVVNADRLVPILDPSIQSDYVVIEEAHHFLNLYDYIVSFAGVHLLIVGQWFPNSVLKLANSVVDTVGICSVCNQPAPYTIEAGVSPNQLYITPTNYYRNVCSKHFPYEQ